MSAPSLPRNNRLTGWIMPALLLLAGCASGQGIPPTGGPPDRTPPAIQAVVPSNGTTNFSGEEIQVTFSESVREETVPSSVSFSPPLERTPEFSWRGKTVTIEPRDPLAEDRTYAVTIGTGVTDLEGNRLARPVTFAFSTGDVIDSARIQGRVWGTTDEASWILAYHIPTSPSNYLDTLDLADVRPDFLVPVGDDGSFSLEALPPGRYRLFAITDARADRVYTPEVDRFGTPAEDVEILVAGETVEGVSIRMVDRPQDRTPPRILGARSLSQNRTSLSFSEPVLLDPRVAEQITVDGSPAAAAWIDPGSPTSLIVQHSLVAGASAIVRVSGGISDSAGFALSDTARSASFVPSTVADTRGPRPLSPEVRLRQVRRGDTIRVQFDEGIRVARADQISLLDTVTGEALPLVLSVTPANALRIFPSIEREGEMDLQLTIGSGAVEDLTGNPNDSAATIQTVVLPARQLGTLIGDLEDAAAPQIPHVVELRSVEHPDEIYRYRLPGTGTWRAENLPAGEYRLSAWRDLDADGEFDFGSLDPWRPGEPYVEMGGTVRVRPRWTTTDVDVRF